MAVVSRSLSTRDSSGPPPEELPKAENSGLTLADLTPLYVAEADLVQQKVGHILTIRGLAVTVFSGILGAALLRPHSGVEFVSLTMLLFYYLDAVYDAYLIPIADREGTLRLSIARYLDNHEQVDKRIALSYREGITHRLTPEGWRPFSRAFFEPQRVGLYAMLVAVPILVVHWASLVPAIGA